MAIALAKVKSRPDLREAIWDMTCDGSYSSGGYAIAPADVGMLTIDSIEAYEKTGQGNLAQWDPTNSKLRVQQTGAALSGVLSEAIGADLSTANVFRLVIKGDPRL
jgi:hypothetical protein